MGDVVPFNFLSFGLASRPKVDSRERKMQGLTIRLPRHMEPKELMIFVDTVL